MLEIRRLPGSPLRAEVDKMDSLIFAIGKCSSLKAALLPDLLTAATWYLLRPAHHHGALCRYLRNREAMKNADGHF